MIVYVVYNKLLEENDSSDRTVVAVVDSSKKAQEYLKKDAYYDYVMREVE